MLVTNHVLSGALIGAIARRRPAAAFAAGIASHFVLDSTPHFGGRATDSREFLRVAVPDGLAGLAAIGLFAAAAPPAVRASVLAGMAGAALPDIDKPAVLWFGRSPFPRAVDQFHKDIQRGREAPTARRACVEAAAGACFAAAALALFRAAGFRAAGFRAVGIPGRSTRPAR